MSPLSDPHRKAQVRSSRFVALWLPALLLAGPVVLAQPSDPLKSPACGQALEALATARATGAQNLPAQAALVEQARKRAARICLGDHGNAPPPGRAAQTPQVVVAPAFRAAPAPPAAPPPPPLDIPRPAVVTACDPGGCWDNHGNRLNRAGPNLIGPSGLCTLQDTLLHCP